MEKVNDANGQLLGDILKCNYNKQNNFPKIIKKDHGFSKKIKQSMLFTCVKMLWVWLRIYLASASSATSSFNVPM